MLSLLIWDSTLSQPEQTGDDTSLFLSWSSEKWFKGGISDWDIIIKNCSLTMVFIVPFTCMWKVFSQSFLLHSLVSLDLNSNILVTFGEVLQSNRAWQISESRGAIKKWDLLTTCLSNPGSNWSACAWRGKKSFQKSTKNSKICNMLRQNDGLFVCLF